MKKWMKFSHEYFLLYLQILFIALFVLVLLAYNLDIAEKSFLESRMLSENVQGIQLGDARVDTDVTLKIPDLDNTEYMLYQSLADDNEIWRGVYGTSDIFGYSDYLSDGRFFSTADYKEKTRVAVVGQNILSKLVSEDGKQYYYYNQQMYEVVGVFKETGEDLDDTVYLNLTALLEEQEHMSLYYIDAKSKEDVSRVLSVLQTYAENKYTAYQIEYESNLTYIGLGRVSNTLLAAGITAAFCNLLITLVFFVTRKKYKVAIQKLCGMTRKDLAKSYGKHLFSIIALSFVSVILIIRFLSRHLGSFFTLEKLAAYHYGILGVILIMLGFAATYFIVSLAKNVNISDSLKGR